MAEATTDSALTDKQRRLYKAMRPLSLVLRAISVVVLFLTKLPAIVIPFAVTLPAAWCYRDDLRDMADWKWVSTLVSLGLISVFFSDIKNKAWNVLKDTSKQIKDADYKWIPCLDLSKAWKRTKSNFEDTPRAFKDSLKKGWTLSLLLLLGVIVILTAWAAQSASQPSRYHVAVVRMKDPKVTEIRKYLTKGGTVFSLLHLNNANASGVGICLGEYEQSWLAAFREAIPECAAVSSLNLEITGFASSAPATPNDEKVNCEFANRRAMAVAGFLTGNERWKWSCDEVKNSLRTSKSLCKPDKTEETYKGNGLSVKLLQWENHDAMAQSRPADDGIPSDGKTSPAEFFNRSVHIEVPEGFCRTPLSLRDKLGTDLLALVEGHAAGGVDRANSYAQSKGLDLRDGRVAVQVVAASDHDVSHLEQRINSLGGSVQSRFENSIFAAIPLPALGTFATDDAVYRIDAERRAFSPQAPNDAKPQRTSEENQ